MNRGLVKPKLLYVLTEDWFFHSHFLERAKAATASGFKVGIVARGSRCRNATLDEGFEFFDVPFKRSSLNPVNNIRVLLKLIHIYRSFLPNILHHVGAKPIMLGSIAASLVGIKTVINAPVGMGFIFSSERLYAKFLRPMVLMAYKLTLKLAPSKIIVENSDDLEMFINIGAVKRDSCYLIRGAGVDLNLFRPNMQTKDEVLVVLFARMLRDKGVREFYLAAKSLRSHSVKARFILVGKPDPENPTSIPEKTLLLWDAEGFVEYWGWRDDISGILGQAELVCLPSYREGLPKTLLEACAAGVPIVTTDTTGCRDAVTDGENGFLVPVRSVAELASALERLINDPLLRRRMAAAGRKRAEMFFGSEQICFETLTVYRDALKLGEL